MSTVRMVSLAQPPSASAIAATAAAQRALFIAGFDRRLLAGFVATVFLPELFLQDRIRLVHRGFAQLPSDDVVVTRVGDVGGHARNFGVSLGRHRRRGDIRWDRQAAGIGPPATATAGTTGHTAASAPDAAPAAGIAGLGGRTALAGVRTGAFLTRGAVIGRAGAFVGTREDRTSLGEDGAVEILQRFVEFAVARAAAVA